jgi:hypothetical protein
VLETRSLPALRAWQASDFTQRRDVHGMARPIEALAAQLTNGLDSERAVAVRIHDYVRDDITFGFTPQHDRATPEETLAAGVGHTIPKTALFIALLRAAGLRAYPHFVTIDHEILRGVFPNDAHRLLPWEVPHCYAEVEIEDDWWQVDSYALDTTLWRAAVARLAREGDLLGYGAHGFGTCRWDGAGDAFAQLATPDMVVEDHGAWESAKAFLGSRAASARDRALAWETLFSLETGPFAAAAAARVNAHLDRLRNGVSAVATIGQV